MFCRACGTKLSEDSVFCSNCGNPVQSGSTTARQGISDARPSPGSTSAPGSPSKVVGDQNAKVTIKDVVVLARLGEPINLGQVGRAFPDAERNPRTLIGIAISPKDSGKEVSALGIRQENPDTATAVFGSGVMICSGAKSEAQARSAVNKVVRLMKERGIPVHGEPVLEVKNIVAEMWPGRKIDVRSLPGRIPGSRHMRSDGRVAVFRVPGHAAAAIVNEDMVALSGVKSESELAEVARVVEGMLGRANLIG